MKIEEKNQSILLRQKGKSMKQIARELGVAKSSVSLWTRDIRLTKGQLRKLKLRGFSNEAIEKRRATRLASGQVKRSLVMAEAAKKISRLSNDDLRLIGLCLYWGEGGKTGRGMARVSNGDPAIIKVMMRFFREIIGVEEKKFRGHIHLHSHLNVEEAEKYWSKISGIPRTQFFRTYLKPSVASKGKKDTLPFGTFDIYVCSTKIFLGIMGQIDKIKTLLVGT